MKCKHGKLKRKVGRRVCRLKPKRRSKAKAKRKVSVRRVQRENRIYDRLSPGEKSAYLKRRLPQYVDLIDSNPHLHGRRR